MAGTDWRVLIGLRVTVRNDRGALYSGQLWGLSADGRTLFMLVDESSMYAGERWTYHKREQMEFSVDETELMKGDEC